MPQEKNTLLRLMVPLGVFLVLGGVVVWGISRSTGQTHTPPATVTQSPEPDAPTPDEAATLSPGEVAAVGDATGTEAAANGPAVDQVGGADQPPTTPPPSPATPLAELVGLHMLPPPADQPEPAPLGSIDESSGYKLYVEFSTIGAGVRSITTADMYETIKHKEHVQIQAEHIRTVTLAGGGTRTDAVVPFAAAGVSINGQFVYLTGTWVEDGPGRFHAVVVDERDRPILRLDREYVVQPGSYDITLSQSLTNQTDGSLTVHLQQFGPTEPPKDKMTYGGDKRRVRFGYLLKPEFDRGLNMVQAKDFLWPRRKALGPKNKQTGLYQVTHELWPNRTSETNEYRLVWTGLTNRYFGVVTYPLVDPALPSPQVDKVLHPASRIDRVLLDPESKDPKLVLRLTSERLEIEPGGRADLSVGVYAGPLHKPTIQADPLPAAVGVDTVVVHNFGSMCAFCTFTWLTGPLLGMLRFLHNYVLFDWALSIIMLVVLVRTVLHPITRWSQIRLQRFGRQMQGLGPKQKKIQERYKDDRKKLQQEMSRLFKEEGISPTGALGCLPMLFQMPVWIALYATLYFAFELRQQPGFFGLFQMIGGWPFLADLAEPDHAIPLGTGYSLPLMGTVTAINVLPLVLGIVFYIQQKYLTPPPSASLTSEQAQQQKIMKVMMVVMFPLIMYNAPSGLSLYFIVNSTLGTLESRWIRSHAEKHGLFDKKPGKAKRKRGFMDRLRAIAEDRQKAIEQKHAKPGKRKR